MKHLGSVCFSVLQIVRLVEDHNFEFLLLQVFDQKFGCASGVGESVTHDADLGCGNVTLRREKNENVTIVMLM